jgi:hypothetical protein
MIDFAPNCLDDGPAQSVPFVELDMSEPIPFKEKYGYCVDVMEHVPPGDVPAVITNIMNAARNVFFQISTVDDLCGVTIGHRLHLTVQPHDFWAATFQRLGFFILWEERGDIASSFLVRNI